MFNNGAHDSVGGQPTVGLKIDLCAVAKAVGYVATCSVETMEELEARLPEIKNAEGPVLLQVCVKRVTVRISVVLLRLLFKTKNLLWPSFRSN